MVHVRRHPRHQNLAEQRLCEEMFFEFNAGTRCEGNWVSERSFSCDIVTRTLKARVMIALAAIKEPTDFLTASNVSRDTYITICEDYTARGGSCLFERCDAGCLQSDE